MVPDARSERGPCPPVADSLSAAWGTRGPAPGRTTGRSLAPTTIRQPRLPVRSVGLTVSPRRRRATSRADVDRGSGAPPAGVRRRLVVRRRRHPERRLDRWEHGGRHAVPLPGPASAAASPPPIGTDTLPTGATAARICATSTTTRSAGPVATILHHRARPPRSRGATPSPLLDADVRGRAAARAAALGLDARAPIRRTAPAPSPVTTPAAGTSGSGRPQRCRLPRTVFDAYLHALLTPTAPAQSLRTWSDAHRRCPQHAVRTDERVQDPVADARRLTLGAVLCALDRRHAQSTTIDDAEARAGRASGTTSPPRADRRHVTSEPPRQLSLAGGRQPRCCVSSARDAWGEPRHSVLLRLRRLPHGCRPRQRPLRLRPACSPRRRGCCRRLLAS